MKITRSESLMSCFVIDECQLKKLTKLLQDNVGEVSFHISRDDGVSYNPETVEDLINDENSKSKQIRYICLSTVLGDVSISAIIQIGYGGINSTFTANEEDIPKIRNKFQDVIAGMQPWYDVVSRHNAWLSVGIAILITFVGTMVFRQHISEILEHSEVEKSAVVPLIVWITASIWFISLGTYKLLHICFPRTFFAIGQGKSRFKRLQWVHGFMAAFLMSLFFFVIKLVIN